jgi:hypothetical protein
VSCQSLRQHHRLQRVEVVRESLIGRRGHTAIRGIDITKCNYYSTTESQCRIYPAACGRHLRSAKRQSMPSSR